MGDIWGYNDGNGRLKADYKSSKTGVIYPAGSSISMVIINDAETKKFSTPPPLNRKRSEPPPPRRHGATPRAARAARPN